MNPLLLLYLCGLMVLSGISQAKEVKIAFGTHKPPYIMCHDKNGLEIDVVREALAFKGHALDPMLFDHRYLGSALKTGRVDAAATVEPLAGDYHYSDSYIRYENVAISKKRMGLEINSIDDLKGRKIVAWGNAHKHLGRQFQAVFSLDEATADNKNYFENHNQQNQSEMFWRDYVEVIIIDRSIFEWYRNQLASKYDTTEAITIHPIFGPETRYPVAFRDETIRDDFNAGLRNLRLTGRYQALYNSHMVSRQQHQ